MLGTMIITAVRDGQTGEITGVQCAFVSGGNKWQTRLLLPGEFDELMLHGELFSRVKAEQSIRRVREEGQISEENVELNHEMMHFLGLRHRAE